MNGEYFGNKTGPFFGKEYMRENIGAAHHCGKDGTSEYAKLEAKKKALVEGKDFI